MAKKLQLALEELDSSCLSLDKRILLNTVTESEDFKASATKREQIWIIFDDLCVTGELNHSEDALLFGVSRAAVEKHYKKYKNGTKKVGKPSLIDEEMKDILFSWINDQQANENWPTLFDIEQFILENYKYNNLAEISKNICLFLPFMI